MHRVNEPVIRERKDLLGNMIGRATERLDIPPALQDAAEREYNELADFIKRDNEADRVASELYPQGSMRLGTVVRPVTEADEYDIDLVYCRHVQKDSVTREQLKQDAGAQLRRYLNDRRRRGADVPKLREGRRCWTLDFELKSHNDAKFHMDVLPSIPDQGGVEGSILITDRELTRWQFSNPKGYGSWFFDRMRFVLEEQRALMAKAAGVDVEEVPEWRVKTPLQRAVQFLKRHRDLRFDGDADDKPISIIITTLAAKSYRSEGDLVSALYGIARGMRDHIELRDGVYWVENPVHPPENFADKWKEYPERAEAFFSWLDQVDADLNLLMEKRGVDEVTGVLKSSLGTPAVVAATAVGHSVREQRENGALKAATGTAMLGASGDMPVQHHNFFGYVAKSR